MSSTTVNVLKFQKLFLFPISNKMLVFRAGIQKNVVRKANREDSDQKQSDLDLLCLSRTVPQATSSQIKCLFEFTKMLTE